MHGVQLQFNGQGHIPAVERIILWKLVKRSKLTMNQFEEKS